MGYRVLVIEDDPLITKLVRHNLAYEGFEIDSVASGDEALARVRSFAPDLILLDLMLPKLDGFEICKAISEGASRIPIIVLSARSAVSDKVRALNLGADDYLTKPFTLDELLARVHAVMRRRNPAPDVLELGNLHVDFASLRAKKGKKTLPLTQREFEVLRLLSSHRGEVVTREQLLRSVWGFAEVPVTRTVDHFIARLRSKIEPDPRRPRYLHTVYGEGYRLTPER